MEREREIYIAPGRGRERYGHGDKDVDSPVKIQAWFSVQSRSVLLQFFEHGLWCHGASSLGMEREVKMRKGSENEKRLREGSEKGKKFQQKIWGKMKWNRGSSNGHNQPKMDVTMHWQRGPQSQLIYGLAIE